MKESRTDNCCETEGSCGHSSHHHHHDYDHQHGCQQHEECGSMAEKILHLTKCAKHELLREKIKKLLEAKIGKKLDKVADVAVNAIIEEMQQKKSAIKTCAQFEEDLRAAFES